MVTVPSGVKVGDEIQARLPSGQTLKFPVPAGTTAGEQVPVFYTPVDVDKFESFASVEASPVSPQGKSVKHDEDHNQQEGQHDDTTSKRQIMVAIPSGVEPGEQMKKVTFNSENLQIILIKTQPQLEKSVLQKLKK
jgi:hypothetical protein